jgi:hypothetical protein
VLTRSEYPRSKPALDAAIEQAHADGWLGENILGRSFDFDVTIVEGAGSYVVGEETALLACLQGLRGTVSARPPFPAERGVHGRPTVVNNIETLANMPSPTPIARARSFPCPRAGGAPTTPARSRVWSRTGDSTPAAASPTGPRAASAAAALS